MSAAGRRRVRRVVELLEETYGPRTWRPRRTGLEGLIATILSQNTSDRNSSAAFRSLRQRFPSWEAVRRAPVVRIADAIRTAGLANVKAIGVFLAERELAQVSMNIVDPFRTPLYRVFELVRVEASRYGIPIVGSEIVGLLPLSVVSDVARYYLRLEDFEDGQILETRL